MNQDILFTGSLDKTVRSWDLLNENGKNISKYKHDSKVMCLEVLVVNSLLSYLLVGCSDGTVWQWDLKLNEFIRYFDVSKYYPVKCLLVNKSDNILVAGDENGDIRLIDIKLGYLIYSFKDHLTSINSIELL